MHDISNVNDHGTVYLDPFDKLSFNELLQNINSIDFEFYNENVAAISYENSGYILINQVKNFTVLCDNVENDIIYSRVVDSGGLNIFTQRLQYNTGFEIIVLASQIFNAPINVTIEYTDKYHLDPGFWKSIIMSITVFASEPPRFSNELQDVQVSSCSKTTIILPDVTDPDSTEFTIVLHASTPEWIKLIDSKTLSVDPENVDFTQDMHEVRVTFLLKDDSEAIQRTSFNLLFNLSEIAPFPAKYR